MLGQAGSIVPAVIFFPLATTGMARLLCATVLPARLAAGLFYAVNPFVFDRLYAGQLGVLLGYALLPFAVDALLDASQRPHRVARAAGWSAATVMMSEHFVWILVPVTAGILRRDRASYPPRSASPEPRWSCRHQLLSAGGSGTRGYCPSRSTRPASRLPYPG